MTVDAVGGVWRYALDAAKGLDKYGIECLIAGFGPAPSSRRMHEAGEIPNVKLVWSDAPLDWMVEEEAALQPVTDALLRMAEDWQADLFHLNLPSQAVNMPHDLPIVVASHSCLPTWWQAVHNTGVPVSLRWQVTRNRRGFDRADAVLVPSASHGKALCQVYGPIEPLCIVHNATSLPTCTAHKEKFVLAAGRWWDEGKNAVCLDRSAASVPWPVIMAGPQIGPTGQRIDIDFAHAPGDLGAEELTGLMRRAAIFASPSRFEPFGLGVLEAAICGACLVLADIPTFRELWHDAAEFVPATDIAAWSVTLNDIIRNEPRRQQLARLGQERAQRFRLPQQAGALARVYHRALDGVRAYSAAAC